MKQVVFCGGGTAGHVYPALAVAEALKAKAKELEFTYVVSGDGPEREIISDEDFIKVEITAARSALKLWQTIPFVFKNIKGVMEAIRLLQKKKPAFVFASGGFSAAPVLMAAKLLKIPYFLHEQNAYMGKVNRMFQNHARQVFTSFPETAGTKGKKNLSYVGNPVRKEFFSNKKSAARKALNLSDDDRYVLVLGGSLGAQAFNKLIAELPETKEFKNLKERFPKLKILLVSGMINSRVFTTVFQEASGIQALPYVDTTLWVPAADLILGRAGASVLMEVAAAGKASIIVPFPLALNRHQDANAKVFKDQAAAVVMDERDLNVKSFCDKVYELLSSEKMMNSMAENVRKLAPFEAAEKIADTLLEVINGYAG